jgi:hypothetical protein
MTFLLRATMGLASLAVIGLLGPSLVLELAPIQDLGGNVFWFLSGALILGIVYLWAQPKFILLVLLHELNHAIVGWLMGARIRSVEASDTVGGAVNYDFDYRFGREVITLAPYFFQPIALLLVGVKEIVREGFDPMICFLIGVVWSRFYFDLGNTLRVPQTDITSNGRGFSTIVILAMNILITGIILTAVAEVTSPGRFLIERPSALIELIRGRLLI